MIFIDTGPFIARYIKNDQYHIEALEKWKKARKLQEVIDKALFDNEQELITKTLEQQEE